MKAILSVYLTLIISYNVLSQVGNTDSEYFYDPAENNSFVILNFVEYIKINSVTGNEKAAGEYLAHLAASKGLHITIFTDEDDSFNFAASLYPLELYKPNVLFLNHIDVVPAGDESLWTYPPWEGTIADGFVWGRGAIDNKSMGIMQLEAISHFVEMAVQNDMPLNFTMLSVSNEENTGILGAKIISEHFLEELNPLAVYGEGGIGVKGVLNSRPDTPFFGIEVDQKTCLWFKVTDSDPDCGHGAASSDNYPAKQIAELMVRLTNAKQPLKLTPLTRKMFCHIGLQEKGLRKIVLCNPNVLRILMPRRLRRDIFFNSFLINTISISSLGSSESAINQKASTVWATFDCRLLPGVSPDEFLQFNRKHFGDLFPMIEIVNISNNGQASETGPYFHALSQAIMEVYEGAATGPILFPAINDNSYFRRKNIPTYGLNPVVLSREQIGTIHNINERIEIESIFLGIEVYKVLIEKLLNKEASLLSDDL